MVNGLLCRNFGDWRRCAVGGLTDQQFDALQDSALPLCETPIVSPEDLGMEVVMRPSHLSSEE